MKLEKKIKYQQPHNIRFDTGNEALDDYLKYKEHRKQKYNQNVNTTKNN